MSLADERVTISWRCRLELLLSTLVPRSERRDTRRVRAFGACGRGGDGG
jgi:hypothetical protein